MKNKTTFYFINSVSLTLIFCVSAIIAGAQTINLQLQSDYTTGIAAQPPIPFAGDVNNDGKPDLVVLNKANTTADGPIAVFLNNGAGGFNAPINILTQLSPNAIALGDYNKDGFLDLAIANDGATSAINIRLGNGTGNFPTGTFIPLNGGTADIKTADFNGDGNLDLVTATNQVSATDLKVLFGNGAGGFAAAVTYAVPFGGSSTIIVADFDANGSPDIAIGESQTIRVFLNNGAGVFTAVPDITGISVDKIVAADFNRDCIPDLAVSGGAGNSVRILLGNGAGGFTAQPIILVPNQPSNIAVGDFNRDRKVDLAIRQITSSSTVPNFTILPGNGAGGFGTPFELTLASSSQQGNQKLAVMDANLDGKADIVIARQGGFFLYHGNSALFTKTENDFDGDGKTDLSVFRPSNGTWYLNRSTSGLTATQWGLGGDKPAAADYDGDGKTDLAVFRDNGFGNQNLSYFFILRSSTNTFQQEQFGRTGDVPLPGDFDGDGKADVAVYRNGAASGAQSFFFYRPSSAAAVDFRTLYWGTNGDVPVRGDFDGDGKADAAVFRPSNALWYVQQSSNGQMLIQSWGTASDKRVPADYDGDGKTDFAVFRPTDNTWYIRNSATGTASSRQWGTNSDALVPGDYNGDGKTEVAAYRGTEGNWYVPQCANDPQRIQRFGAVGDAAIPSTLLP